MYDADYRRGFNNLISRAAADRWVQPQKVTPIGAYAPNNNRTHSHMISYLVRWMDHKSSRSRTALSSATSTSRLKLITLSGRPLKIVGGQSSGQNCWWMEGREKD